MFQKVRGVLSLIVAAGSFSSALALPAQRALAAPDSKNAPILIAKGEQKGAAKAATSLKWYRSYNEAAKAAKESKKWILVDVYTDWCHWCTRLDQDVYSNLKIKAFLNRSFICVKADAEKGDGVAIKEKYGVDGFPCTLILAPNGKLKGRIDGYVPLNEFPGRIVQILQSR